MLHEVNSLSELNATSQQFYSGALADNDSLSPPLGSELAKVNLGWVDVRDVALAHVRAIEVDEAGGKRFILCNYATNWEDWRKRLLTFRCCADVSPHFNRKYCQRISRSADRPSIASFNH